MASYKRRACNDKNLRFYSRNEISKLLKSHINRICNSQSCIMESIYKKKKKQVRMTSRK